MAQARRSNGSDFGRYKKPNNEPQGGSGGVDSNRNGDSVNSDKVLDKSTVSNKDGANNALPFDTSDNSVSNTNDVNNTNNTNDINAGDNGIENSGRTGSSNRNSIVDRSSVSDATSRDDDYYDDSDNYDDRNGDDSSFNKNDDSDDRNGDYKHKDSDKSKDDSGDDDKGDGKDKDKDKKKSDKDDNLEGKSKDKDKGKNNAEKGDDGDARRDMKRIAKGAKAAVNAATTGAKVAKGIMIINAIQNFLKMILAVIKAVVNAIKGFFIGIFNAVTSFFAGAFTATTAAIAGALSVSTAAATIIASFLTVVVAATPIGLAYSAIQHTMMLTRNDSVCIARDYVDNDAVVESASEQARSMIEVMAKYASNGDRYKFSSDGWNVYDVKRHKFVAGVRGKNGMGPVSFMILGFTSLAKKADLDMDESNIFTEPKKDNLKDQPQNVKELRTVLNPYKYKISKAKVKKLIKKGKPLGINPGSIIVFGDKQTVGFFLGDNGSGSAGLENAAKAKKKGKKKKEEIIVPDVAIADETDKTISIKLFKDLYKDHSGIDSVYYPYKDIETNVDTGGSGSDSGSGSGDKSSEKIDAKKPNFPSPSYIKNTPSNTTPSQVMARMYKVLTENADFSKKAAAAVLANVKCESGFKVNAGGDASSGAAWGLFQMEAGRLADQKAYCKEKTGDEWNVEAQTEWALKEDFNVQFAKYSGNGSDNRGCYFQYSGPGSAGGSMVKYTGSYPKDNENWAWWPSESFDFDKFANSNKRVEELTEIYCRVFERASIPHMDNRKKAAREILAKHGVIDLASENSAAAYNNSDDGCGSKMSTHSKPKFSGKIEELYFCQWKPPYKDEPYDNGYSIGGYGCGLCSATCAVAVVGNRTDITPIDVVKEIKKHGDAGTFCCGLGTYHGKLGKVAGYYGLDYDYHSISSAEGLAKVLSKGGAVVAPAGGNVFNYPKDKNGGRGGKYSSGGHYICFWKYDNGKFYVKDSGRGDHGNIEYTEEDVNAFLANSGEQISFYRKGQK